MRRYWVHKKPQGQVELDGDLYHHLVDVCRQRVGAQFELLNEGHAYLVEIVEIQKNSLRARVLKDREIAPLKKPYIHLCVSLPKISTFEWILEKSVELGAYEVCPFTSDFSFVRSGQSDRVRHKAARWSKIIQSATQQTGRGDLMGLRPIVPLEDLIQEMNRTPNSTGLFPYEGDCQESMKSYISRAQGKEMEHIWIFVGSEGGFSQKEVELFQSQDLPPVSLGDQVLRVETACLSLLSILRYELNLN